MLIRTDNQFYTVISHTDKFVIGHNGKYTETFEIDEVEEVYVSDDEIIPECLMYRDIFAVTESGLENGEDYEYTNKKS